MARRRDDPGAAPLHSPHRIRLAGAWRRIARSCGSRFVCTAKCWSPCTNGRRDRHDGPGGYDSGRARPHGTRLVRGPRDNCHLHPGQFCPIVRVAIAVGGTWTTPLLIASASLWIGAFVLFITYYE